MNKQLFRFEQKFIISQQRAELDQLVIRLSTLFEVIGPLTDNQVAELQAESEADESVFYVIYEEFACQTISVSRAVNDLGGFMVTKLNDIVVIEERDAVLRSIGLMWLTIIAGIYSVCARRTSLNEAVHEDKDCLASRPRELVQIGGAEFSELIEQQRPRLLTSLTAIQIQHIEDEHRLLRKEYRDNAALKIAIDTTADTVSFKASWEVEHLNAQVCFLHLMEFAGGLATPFPTTATVESDFSIVRWEKDAGRGGLNDFTLEGIMQSKMHLKLLELAYLSYDE